MEIIGKDNGVKQGFLTYPEFARELENALTEQAITNAIPDQLLKNIRHIVVTGNGDSYVAALATKEFNSKMFMNCDYQVLRCLDVSRHHVFSAENPEQTLVMVISVSGSGSRVTEAMHRAAVKGCATLAITANPNSRMAAQAQYVLQIPAAKAERFTPARQAKSYVTALSTTLLMGLHAGLVRGNITGEQAQLLRREMVDYVARVCTPEVLDRVDAQMETLAQTWKDYRGYGFVGGGSDFSTAYFGCAKFFELCGSINSLNDSEDWCHIDFFQTNRQQLGTIVVASKNCASFSRSWETILSMRKSQRNVLVITDAAAEEFPQGVSVCTLPETEHDYVNPLMQFLPLSMLANYIAIARDYPYFGGMDASNPLFSQEGGINTIKSSEIQYFD